MGIMRVRHIMESIMNGLMKGGLAMAVVKRVIFEEIVLMWRVVVTGRSWTAGDLQSTNGFGVRCTRETEQNVVGRILARI